MHRVLLKQTNKKKYMELRDLMQPMLEHLCFFTALGNGVQVLLPILEG